VSATPGMLTHSHIDIDFFSFFLFPTSFLIRTVYMWAEDEMWVCVCGEGGGGSRWRAIDIILPGDRGWSLPSMLERRSPASPPSPLSGCHSAPSI